MSETVQTIAATILALSPQARYRLASRLFERNETALAHVIIRSGIVDETAADGDEAEEAAADTLPAPVSGPCPMEMACITGAPTCATCLPVIP